MHRLRRAPLQLLCWVIFSCSATEQKCKRDCLLPKKKGYCPSGRNLARRYVNWQVADTGVDIADEIDPKSFNLHFKKIDFDFCQNNDKNRNGTKDIRQLYHARVDDIDELPDPYADDISAGQPVRPYEWVALNVNATDYTAGTFTTTTAETTKRKGTTTYSNTNVTTNTTVFNATTNTTTTTTATTTTTTGTKSYSNHTVNVTSKVADTVMADGFLEFNFSQFPSGRFPFYNLDYKSAYLSSNGFIAFRTNSSASSGKLGDVFQERHPRILPFFAPLKPEAGGSVRVRHWNVSGAERITFTFIDVPLETNRNETSTFQLSLFATGRIRMAWTDVSNVTEAVVGIMTGQGADTFKATEFAKANKCLRNPECRSEASSTRLVGPTRPSDPDVYIFGLHKTIPLRLTKPHPYAVHPDPNPYTQFCSIGCTFYFTAPKIISNATRASANATASTLTPAPSVVPTAAPTDDVETSTLQMCLDRCSFAYRYNITTGYNDAAEVARLECWDGCQIANLRCQAGYSCFYGQMTECPPGTYRHNDYERVEECYSCPPGRYREESRGRELDSCSMCKSGRYVNVTGSDNSFDCLRCPAGKFAPEAGMAQCKCIFDQTFPDECENKFGVEVYDDDYRRPGVATLARQDTYDGVVPVNIETFEELREKRDSVPFEGRF